MRALLRLFAVPDNEPRFVAAQVRALTRQIPVLHVILMADALTVAYTHFGSLPNWLTLYPLAVVLPVCAWRGITWARRSGEALTPEAALRQLRSTNRLTGVICAGFAVWALLLWRYSDAAAQVQVMFSVTITMIACVFCLMHLRSATRIIGLIALPLALYFALAGSVTVSAIALNFSLVIAAMMFVQAVFHNDFRGMVSLSEQNRELALTDMLTGLPNRRSFFEHLDDRLQVAATNGTSFGLGMIDLDGFKPVNDTLGHQAGDAVLQEVAQRLQKAMHGIGWAARLGGDEFGLIIDGSADVEALGRSLCAALQVPCTYRTSTAQIGASIGFAHYPYSAETAGSLVERADYALYHAKSHHRGTAICFSQEHEQKLRSQSVIEHTLRHADLVSEFDLAYQPILDSVTGTIISFEALARWQSPTLGRVSPADFIVVAERAGLIERLTQVLLAKALSAMCSWPREVQLSFNLSTCDIASPEAVAAIAQRIAESGVAPERIIFEVTETALMRDCADARQALLELKSLGVAVALDDFGSGYSSLSYVHRLPIDKLKVDRSFIVDVCHDDACRAIVKSAIDLCRNLGVDCVVEGVETQEQMLIVRALGCWVMQGYFFSRPVSQSEATKLVRTTAAGSTLPADAQHAA